MAQVNARKRGKKWEYYFDIAKIDGSRKKETKCGFATKKEALEAGNIAFNEYTNAGLTFVPSEISVCDYLDLWMTEYCEVNLKPETRKNYRKKIKNHIKPVFQKYKLRTITPAVLQIFLNDKFNSGLSRNSIATIKGILSKSFEYAVEPLKFIKVNPMDHVKLPAARAIPKILPKVKPHVYISADRIKQIFARFPEGTSTHIPMMFAYRGGARPGESFAFFWEDIDLENAEISINRQVQWDDIAKVWYFSDPKYDSFRTIEIDYEFVELLRREKERQERARVYYGEHYTHLYENKFRQLNSKGDGKEIHLVCIRENGEFIIPRSMQHTSSVIHHDFNFPEFDMHSLRTTHSTMLAETHASPVYVQRRLGHKNIQVTLQFYTKLTQTISNQGRCSLNQMFMNDHTAY